jgi:hypothetical protein
VSVYIEAGSAVTGPALEEDVPTGWTVTPVDNAGWTFNPSTLQWIYLSAMTTGQSVTIVYDVTVPSGASYATYGLSGQVSAYGVGPFVVEGDDIVTVIEDWNLWKCDGIITISELQEAVYYWLQAIPVNGHTVLIGDLQEMVFQWMNP